MSVLPQNTPPLSADTLSHAERDALARGDSFISTLSQSGAHLRRRRAHDEFVDTLEAIATGVERLVILMEAQKEPIITADEFGTVSQSVVFCADQLTIIDETLREIHAAGEDGEDEPSAAATASQVCAEDIAVIAAAAGGSAAVTPSAAALVPLHTDTLFPFVGSNGRSTPAAATTLSPQSQRDNDRNPLLSVALEAATAAVAAAAAARAPTPTVTEAAAAVPAATGSASASGAGAAGFGGGVVTNATPQTAALAVENTSLLLGLTNATVQHMLADSARGGATGMTPAGTPHMHNPYTQIVDSPIVGFGASQRLARSNRQPRFLRLLFDRSPEAQRLRKRPVFSRKIIRWLALGALVWQLICVGLLVMFSAGFNINDPDATWVKVVLALLCILQLCHIIVSVSVLYKIGSQIAHLTISFETLVQSYMSTVLVFSGVYFLFTCIRLNSFKGLELWHGDVHESLIVTTPATQIVVFLHMFYFSCTTMTGCGFGDITPQSWYAVLTVTLQQLLSVTFTTVIFGLALQHFTTRMHLRKKALERQMEEENM